VILVEPDGSVLGCYRKVHLPGTQEPRENVNFQQLEKALFRI
jgi:N-carbamoyl-D-amino-acid hydrolase